jgi:hypothetical protein
MKKRKFLFQISIGTLREMTFKLVLQLKPAWHDFPVAAFGPGTTIASQRVPPVPLKLGSRCHPQLISLPLALSLIRKRKGNNIPFARHHPTATTTKYCFQLESGKTVQCPPCARSKVLPMCPAVHELFQTFMPAFVQKQSLNSSAPAPKPIRTAHRQLALSIGRHSTFTVEPSLASDSAFRGLTRNPRSSSMAMKPKSHSSCRPWKQAT